MGSKRLPTGGKWRFLGGRLVPCLKTTLEQTSASNKYTFHVGTDSKPFKDYTIMSTAICLRQKGSGVLLTYRRLKIDNFNSLAERLLFETTESISVAQMIRDLTGMVPTVHADVNIKDETESNKMLSTVEGMIKGMGFESICKPDAWAADIADMFTR